MFGAIQPWHIIVLVVIVVALFGYNKLPDVTRSVGRSLRIFKTEMKGLSEDDKVREEAREQGTTAVAPSVTPVVPVTPTTPGSVTDANGVVVAAPTVATTVAADAAHTDPTAEQIAHAQAVLAAAERTRAGAAAGSGDTTTSVNSVNSSH